MSATTMALWAEPVISEVMASNTATLADEDGAYSDWVEIHNPDASPVDLAGWYLTDTAANKTKWVFPAVTIEPGGYLVVFASNKDRRVAGARLHTNFALSAGGEYLGLIRADGTTVVSEFAPTFPAQSDDVSYGRVTGDPARVGFFQNPTPGAANGGAENLRLSETVRYSRPSGPFLNSITVELSGAGAGQLIRYVLTNVAAGEVSEPTAESPLYTGPIALHSTALIKAAVFSSDGSMQGRASSAHYLHVGVDIAGFSSQLPVLVLDDFGAGPLVKDGVDHASWAYGFNGTASGSATFGSDPLFDTPLVTTVRGSSSADFPKKGFNVKVRDEFGAKSTAAFFDLPTYEKWALVAPWSFDMNFINNSFVYALSNHLGRWAPRTQLAEVFFNTGGDDLTTADYAGIYVISDRVAVAAGRVAIASLSSSDNSVPAITGGYLLKIDEPDADEIGWRTQHGLPEGESSVVLVTPEADDVTPAQLDFIQTYVQRMENALFADRSSAWSQRTYLDYIDRASWVDHHLLNVFVSNPDAFHRSAYFTKDRNGKLSAGPVWDFDRALGAFWDDRGSVVNTWSGVGGNAESVDFWRTGWWGIIAEDPEFRQDWVDRWQNLRQNELSTANLTELAQSLADTVGAAAAARDVERWPDTASPYGDYAAQIAHLKSWLAERAAWIDQQFVAAPTMADSSGAVTFTPPAGAVLVYTMDGTDPRSLGGEIAIGAQVSVAPLSVPATANVHVRAYNEALKNAFPGTPWSAAIGGEASSPLAPKPRLVNISSRAVVGQGADALIAGVFVADSEAKPYLARAAGPGLVAFGASNPSPDPQLSLFSANGVELARNNGWQNSPDAARMAQLAKSVGAFPFAEGSADSALVGTLGTGAYTLQITSPSGQLGVGLAELYELDRNGRTVNLSTRARVRTGDGALIGGFVIAGPAYQRVLIRGIGPTLASFGVSDALVDAEISVYSGDTIVASNDRWETGPNAELLAEATRRAGAFALAAGSEDAALLVTLPPGAYTVAVRGKAEGEGIALLEIYAVP